MYVSNDKAATWTRTALPVGMNYTSVACSNSGKHMTAVCTESPCIYISRNYGVTWALASFCFGNTCDLALYPFSISNMGKNTWLVGTRNNTVYIVENI